MFGDLSRYKSNIIPISEDLPRELVFYIDSVSEDKFAGGRRALAFQDRPPQ
jgi:hypothetical protein